MAAVAARAAAVMLALTLTLMALGTQVQEFLIHGSTDGVPPTDTGARALPILHTGQRLHVIPYVWNPDTLAYEPQEKGAAGTGGAGDASAANQVTEIARLTSIRDQLLAQLDVALSTRASQATVASILAQLDVALSTRASQATVAAILAQLDVALSTRAADATLTGGTAKAIARGGAKGTTAAADITSTASGANHQGADVVLYDAAGNLIDPRQIRALTNADVVDISDRAGRLAGKITADDGGLVTLGTLADAEAAAGNGSAIALLKRIRTLLAVSSAIPATNAQGVVVRPVDNNRASVTTVLNAAGQAVEVELDGMFAAGVEIGASDLVGTLVAQAWNEIDNTWQGTSIIDANLGWGTQLVNPAASKMYTAIFHSGVRKFRILCSVRTSGSATVCVKASKGMSPFALAPSTSIEAVNNPFFISAVGGRDLAGLARTLRLNNALPAFTDWGQIVHVATLPGGDVDHDAVDTLKNIQMGGYASPVDVPPTAVSANGDRVRAWLDRYGSQVVRRRKIRETYTAVFRLAETAARLDQTFTHVANTNKQWATLHHLATATKEVRLQLCIVWITSAITVAPQGILELRQVSAAPATGNPSITPTPRRRGGTAAEATCLYLPTTAGTEAGVDKPLGHHVFDEAVSVATNAFQHPQGFGRGGIVLFDASQEDDEAMQPVLPVGTLDGWAIVTRLTGATVMRLTAMMVFTEEVP